MKSRKFKIGDKVRVKTWFEMPQYVQGSWGMLTRCVGDILTVYAFDVDFEGINVYNLSNDLLVLEPEIEPIIKKGEQLVFNFMRE